jgi:hypothetical protein
MTARGVTFVTAVFMWLAVITSALTQQPTDVTADVRVELGGVRLNRATGRFVGVATVTNVSGTSISGPISVVFTLEGKVTLFKPDGVTSETSPQGRGFINLPLTANALPPAAVIRVTLEFNNPGKEPIVATTKILSGPGTR